MRVRYLVLAVLAAFAVGLSLRASAKERPRATPPVGIDVLRAPEGLSEAARQALRRRMQRHGQDMIELMTAVTLLDHQAAKAAADRIGAAPALTRPKAGGVGDPGIALPERFFLLQDEARTHAHALGEAARRRDDAALASHLGALTSACVSCHAIWLEGPK